MKIKLKHVISAHQFGLFREAKNLIAKEFGSEHARDLKLQSGQAVEEIKVFAELSTQARLTAIYDELLHSKPFLLKTNKKVA